MEAAVDKQQEGKLARCEPMLGCLLSSDGEADDDLARALAYGIREHVRHIGLVAKRFV